VKKSAKPKIALPLRSDHEEQASTTGRYMAPRHAIPRPISSAPALPGYAVPARLHHPLRRVSENKPKLDAAARRASSERDQHVSILQRGAEQSAR